MIRILLHHLPVGWTVNGKVRYGFGGRWDLLHDVLDLAIGIHSSAKGSVGVGCRRLKRRQPLFYHAVIVIVVFRIVK